MGDALTECVLGYQKGAVSLDLVRNRVMETAFGHLGRYRRKGEDEVSEFLLVFYHRIDGLLQRFQDRGLPFRHYLLRSLRWQWNTFRAERSRLRRQAYLAADLGLGMPDDEVAEPPGDWEPVSPLSDVARRRLVLLALKAAPWLEEGHLEAVSRETGIELPWLQTCQRLLKERADRRRQRRAVLTDKRGDAYYRRLMAEDEARRETDPDRRRVCERRASMYRARLAHLTQQQLAMSTAPTHLDLAELLGMPKGSVDSSLYHLKKEIACVYSGRQYDRPRRHKQRPQETGT